MPNAIWRQVRGQPLATTGGLIVLGLIAVGALAPLLAPFDPIAQDPYQRLQAPFALSLATAILDAVGLSFLGLGAQPPTPEWGAMLNGGRELLLTAPRVMIFPGLAIFSVALGLNLLGDGLRDALDPKRLTVRIPN